MGITVKIQDYAIVDFMKFTLFDYPENFPMSQCHNNVLKINHNAL